MMGNWGTALYSDDTASDIQDICNEVYSLVDAVEAEKIIFSEYKEILNSSKVDNDYAVFWYALADWQWNHGVLSDTVKKRASELLNIHAGIEEWEESGNKKDVEKRITVLDKLYEKITSKQPPVKIPEIKLAKAKHKPGDIIVFKTCEKIDDSENNVWNIEYCGEAFMFKDPRFEKTPSVLAPPYDAHGKYIAILCVGSEKIPHSQYVTGYYDEYSTYVFYDYISDIKPDIDMLKKCGFLPAFLRYAELYGAGIETIGWTYTFILYSYSFRKRKDACEEITDKYFCDAEALRFLKLFSQKNYLKEPLYEFEMHEAFFDFFRDKIRLSYINESVDNLLCENNLNPLFKPINEINKLIHKQSKKETEELMLKLIRENE